MVLRGGSRGAMVPRNAVLGYSRQSCLYTSQVKPRVHWTFLPDPRIRWITPALVVVAALLLMTGAAPIGVARPPSTTPKLHRLAQPITGVATLPWGATALAASADPTAVCAGGGTNCSAGAGVARVTLSSEYSNASNWSSVQVAFILDASPYAGLWDSAGLGGDPCASNGSLCEESNGIPFLVHNSSEVATEIQAAHPGVRVSFAMLDYFDTCDGYGDCDGAAAHLDVANFTANATLFGKEAVANFTTETLGGYVMPDEDFGDSLLHSASIRALYGAMMADLFDWSNDSHHVLVWVGLTAPRDPYYTQNYSVSPEATNPYGRLGMSPSCEPSYNFSATISIPECTGWVNNSSPNSTTSVANVARNSTGCSASLGGSCTIDAIDLWSTPTDPMSKGWPIGQSGGGPGGSIVKQNTRRVLDAGCAIANATGGSWDGPSYFACPNGRNGTLELTSGGPHNFSNPTLAAALANVSFGTPGGATPLPGRPMFSFVPFGPVQLATPLDVEVTCTTPAGTYSGCDQNPSRAEWQGISWIGWNWTGSLGRMPAGSTWTASFNVIVGGLPIGRSLPADVCSTATCILAEGNASGPTSGMAYRGESGLDTFSSFPLVNLTVAGPNPLSVNISVSTSQPLYGVPLTFTADSSGGWGFDTYAWSFGDGQYASGPRIDHTFSRPGQYSIVATVIDSLGQRSNETVLLDVGEVPPSARLVVLPSVTTVGRPVTLVAGASGESQPLAYTWSGLPPGCFSYDVFVLNCTPLSAGQFEVNLTVQDPYGWETNTSTRLLVNPPVESNLSDSVGPPACGANEIDVTFSAAATGGTPSYQYLWAFGSTGLVAEGPTVEQGFSPGSFHQARVEVIDSVGATANSTLAIRVPSSLPCAAAPSSAYSAFISSPNAGALWLALGITVGILATALLGRAKRQPPLRRPGRSGATTVRPQKPPARTAR